MINNVGLELSTMRPCKMCYSFGQIYKWLGHNYIHLLLLHAYRPTAMLFIVGSHSAMWVFLDFHESVETVMQCKNTFRLCVQGFDTDPFNSVDLSINRNQSWAIEDIVQNSDLGNYACESMITASKPDQISFKGLYLRLPYPLSYKLNYSFDTGYL